MTDFEKRDYNARMAVFGAAKYLIELGHNVVSVNLYGSQNYDCDTPTSDFDFKAIVVPSMDDVIFNRKPISTSIEFEGGLIDIKDIRLMFDNYKKQNVNFIETLFTRWYWAAPDFVHEWERAREMADRVAFADPAKSINCMIGMAKEKEHALAQLYPSKVAIVEKYGFDPKQLMHIIRLYNLMQRFVWKLERDTIPTYGDLLIPDDNTIDYLMMIKTMTMETPITVEQAKAMAAEHIALMEDIRDRFKNAHEDQWGFVDEATYADFDAIRGAIMRKGFATEIFGGNW
jgi:predicted nucleotidyltransferase